MADVLVIEDYPVHGDLLARWLTRWGHRVLVVADGAAGLAAAQATHPAVILLDVRVPEMDELDVARHLKADPATALIRIIAVTACLMPGERERCLAAGCDEYEPKPVDFARLQAKIRMLCTPDAAPGEWCAVARAC